MIPASSPKIVEKKQQQQQQQKEKPPKQERPPKQENNNQNKQQQGKKQENNNAGSSRPRVESKENFILPTEQKGNNNGNNQRHNDKNSDAKTVSSEISQNKRGGYSQNTSNLNNNSTQIRTNQLKLFDHLFRKSPPAQIGSIEGDSLLHPSTIKLGLLFRTGKIFSDDDRVAALSSTLFSLISDYNTPAGKSLNRDLIKSVDAQVQHIVDQRQLSVGMGNFIKHVKSAIQHIPSELNETDAKRSICKTIRVFMEEKVSYARESIIKNCLSIIKNDDVIMTFGSSPLMRQVFLAVAEQKKFRLVIVDTNPLNEGLSTLSLLSPHISCIYTTLSGAASMMRDTSHVFVGASALLSNGSVLAPAGTAMISSLAKYQRVPVIVVAETYKFSEKVQLDSIVFNELGCTDEIAEMNVEGKVIPQSRYGFKGPLFERQEKEPRPQVPFQIVNLRYDLSQLCNISAVVTEIGLIPPTSIPVLIREFQTDQQQNSNLFKR